MNNQIQCFETALNNIIKSKDPKTQVRSKFKSDRGRSMISDDIIEDCISLSTAITLNWARGYEHRESNINKERPSELYLTKYFFRTLWTNVSEEYKKVKDHSCVILEFSEKIYYEEESADVVEHLIKNEMVDFIKQELLDLEAYDIYKKDSVFLNKMKKSEHVTIKKFAIQTQEMIEKNIDCSKRLIYVRSFFSENCEIVDASKICIEEIMAEEKVSSLVHYSICKNYSKNYLENKTLQGLAVKMLDEGKSMAEVSREKKVLFEPLRTKIAGVRAKVQIKKAA